MTQILSLLAFSRIRNKVALVIIPFRMGSCFVVFVYVCRLVVGVFILCVNSIMKDMWEGIAQFTSCLVLNFGRLCVAMLNDLWHGVMFVSKQRVKLLMWVCICLYPFPHSHGLTLAWTLFWAFLEPNVGTILFSWWWIVFPRWFISYHAKRLRMPLVSQLCSFGRFIVYMVCRCRLCPTEILGF